MLNTGIEEIIAVSEFLEEAYMIKASSSLKLIFLSSFFS